MSYKTTNNDGYDRPIMCKEVLMSTQSRMVRATGQYSACNS
jgi:hypothetical protein